MAKVDVHIQKERPLSSFALSGQLESSFRNLHRAIPHKEIKESDKRRILTIIERNDRVAELINGPEYQDILSSERELKGEDTKVGVIICIDGRISILHQFGRTVNTWETAGSLIDLTEDESQVNSILFNEILRDSLNPNELGKNRELFEVVTAHTSLSTDHKCGAIQAGIDAGTYPKDKAPVDIALEEADKRRVAIENTYNKLLKNSKKEPQKQVAITALIDTDTMGFILNYGKPNELSTTKLLMERGLAEAIEFIAGEHIGGFGSMAGRFTETDSFIEYSKKVLAITKMLLEIDTPKIGFREYISQYLNTNFQKLSDSQKKALSFIIARTVASQYLTGLSKIPESGHPEHNFSEHQEDFMAVSLNGKTVGRFDIQQQAFGSSPSSIEDAISQTKTKLSILDKHRKNDDPDILFVSNPIDRRIWEERNPMMEESRRDNAELYMALIKNKEIGKRVKQGKLVFVPVLVDQNTGAVLEILDHSIHL